MKQCLLILISLVALASVAQSRLGSKGALLKWEPHKLSWFSVSFRFYIFVILNLFPSYFPRFQSRLCSDRGCNGTAFLGMQGHTELLGSYQSSVFFLQKVNFSQILTQVVHSLTLQKNINLKVQLTDRIVDFYYQSGNMETTVQQEILLFFMQFLGNICIDLVFTLFCSF